MIRRSIKKYAALSALAALTLSGCSAEEGKTELRNVKVAITTASLAQKEDVAVFAVAEQLGFYAEEGITIEVFTNDGSTAALQAVASGSADVTSPDLGSILGGQGSSVPVSAVGGLVINWPWSIAVPASGSNISSGEDLKGTKIGVISLASGSHPFARAFVEASGLDPETDADFLPVGVGAQASAALDQGTVDSLALYGQAYAVLEQSGAKLKYLENPPIFEGIRSLTFTISNEDLEKDADFWAGFLRASYKALLFSIHNPEAAMQLGYKQYPQMLSGVSEEEQLQKDVPLLKSWLESATPIGADLSTYKEWGVIPQQDWEKTNDFSLEAGQIEQAIDYLQGYSGALLEKANDFDPQEIIDMANNFEDEKK